jgi:hypothetical protein
MEPVLAKLRQEIAHGVARNQAIIRARKAGATLQAIGEVLGVTQQRVRQILDHQWPAWLLGEILEDAVLPLRRQHFLNANLVDEVLTPQIYQMRPLFIVGQVCADALHHCHDERLVIYIKPVRAAGKFIFAVADKGITES